MSATAYQIALITRGAGAYAYSWSGPPGLPRGSIVALSFRHRLELGAVLGEDPQPPAELLPLWPIAGEQREWGALLLDIAELALAGADEVAGHLLFSGPATGLRVELSITDAAQLSKEEQSVLGALSGRLTPARAKQLIRAATWERLCALAHGAALQLTLGIAGLPGQTRAAAMWRRWYAIDKSSARLLGLGGTLPDALPGSFLAGYLPALDYSKWPTAQRPASDASSPNSPVSKLRWQSANLASGWEIGKVLHMLAAVPLRRVQASWSLLRKDDGLPADLMAGAVAGQNTLAVFPQQWMLDRLWPLLSPCAERAHRFHATAGPGAAAHILGALSQGGQIVCGTQSAWKLSAYGYFDRVILLDPSHPQYEPESDPAVDPRSALLAALARRGGRLDIIELGLSTFDGYSALQQIRLLSEHEPQQQEPQPGELADSDPLPPELRRPGRRRLVYFNRLGGSRHMQCMECSAAVVCPLCGSKRINYSYVDRHYSCPDCDYSNDELRCAKCGLANIAAQSPGLEALTRQPGDVVVTAAQLTQRLPAEVSVLIGTSQLLEAKTEFWPQDIVYVHAEERLGVHDYWPAAFDLAARLWSLYDNPQLEHVYIVSRRLQQQFGDVLDATELAARFLQELKLRKLAGLPPAGRLLRLRVRAGDQAAAIDARQLVGDELRAHPATTLLRMGGVYPFKAAWHAAGYAVNLEIAVPQLQALRWRLQRDAVSLTLRATRGPWL